MNNHLVVAHYRENIEWIDRINANLDITIYHKGEILSNNERFRSIFLPNIGREGHTYIRHIVDNYDNLPDWCIFSQGSPFDHVSNWIEIISGTEQDWMNLSHMKKRDSFGNIKAYFFNTTHNVLAERLVDGGSEYPFFWNKLFLQDSSFIDRNIDEVIFRGEIADIRSTNYSLMNDIMEGREKKAMLFCPAAHFIIHRDFILMRDRKFYENILEIFESSENISDPSFGYVLERFWCYIFDISFE